VTERFTAPIFEPLQTEHDRSNFDCGVEPLNRYIKELASQDIRRKTAAVFVLRKEGSAKVLGYYTLSQCSIQLEHLPEALRKNLPRYPQIPTTLLGRMAVDQSCRGQGSGRLLLMDALRRASLASHSVASFAVVVDAMQVDPDPIEFYRSYDFEALPEQPRRLILPFHRYEKLFE